MCGKVMQVYWENEGIKKNTFLLKKKVCNVLIVLKKYILLHAFRSGMF